MSYRIIPLNYFYVCHKNRPKHNQHSQLLIFKINSLLQETPRKPMKVEAAKTSFPCASFIYTNCFNECFFIPYDNFKTFFIQIYCYSNVWCFERSLHFISIIFTITLQCYIKGPK